MRRLYGKIVGVWFAQAGTYSSGKIGFWSITTMADLKLNIAESPSDDLTIVKYSADRFPEFQDLFAHRDWEAKHPLDHWLRKPDEDQVSIVLHNTSSRNVTMLALRWTFPETPGRTNVSRQASSSYGVNVFRPMIAAGEKVLISPLSDSVQESLLTHVKAGGGTMGAHFSSSRDPELPDDGEIGFALNLVGFEDGEIAGPDPDRFAAKVNARKHAAEYIARQIRQAENESRDPRPVLQALTELPHSREDHFLSAVQSFARDYMSIKDLPSPQQRLHNLENLLGPPRFFRKPDSGPAGMPLPS
jgi:hypothetical protein